MNIDKPSLHLRGVGRHLVGVSLVVMIFVTGCVSWTERDYELQEKAYEKERQQKKQEQQSHGVVRW